MPVDPEVADLLQRAKAQLEKAEARTATAIKKQEELQGELSIANYRLRTWHIDRKELSRLSTQCEDLKKQVKALEKKCDRGKNECAHLNGRNKNLLSKNAELVRKSNDLLVERIELRRKVEDLEDQLKKTNESWQNIVDQERKKSRPTSQIFNRSNTTDMDTGKPLPSTAPPHASEGLKAVGLRRFQGRGDPYVFLYYGDGSVKVARCDSAGRIRYMTHANPEHQTIESFKASSESEEGGAYTWESWSSVEPDSLVTRSLPEHLGSGQRFRGILRGYLQRLCGTL